MDTKKKVFKLKDDPADYSIIAISCTESLHKLAWHINTALSINLTEGESIHIPAGGGGSLDFPTHKYYHDANEVQYSLIKNRVDRALLIKPHPNVDFFFKVAGADHPKISLICNKLIKAMPEVTAAIPIAMSKTKVFLVFDSV
jgi:hypothetical protein